MNARYRDIFYLVGCLVERWRSSCADRLTRSAGPRAKWGLPISQPCRVEPTALFVGIARDGVYFLRCHPWPPLWRQCAGQDLTLTIGWSYFRPEHGDQRGTVTIGQITVQDVSKRSDSSATARAASKRRCCDRSSEVDDFWVLRNIDFDIEPVRSSA